MKVCHIVDRLPILHKEIGGAEWAAYRMIKAQNKLLDVFVISSNRTKEVEKTDIKFYEVPINSKSFSTKIRMGLLPFNKKIYHIVKQILKKEKPDILHLHEFKYFGFSALKAAKDIGIKVVFSVYDYWLFCPLSKLYIQKERKICETFHGIGCVRCFSIPGAAFYLRKKIFEKYAKLIDWFIVISEDSKDILLHNKIPSRKITVSSLVLDFSKFSKLKKEKKTILYAGWLVPHKGLDILIRGLEGTDYKLIAVGDMTVDPSYSEECRNLAKDLKVNVDFIGRTSNEQVINYMRRCEFLAVPEQWRIPLSTVMLEGMSIGSKVIGSSMSSTREYLPKQNIFNTYKDIKGCLKKAKFLKTTFDDKKIVYQTIRIYNSLLKYT